METSASLHLDQVNCEHKRLEVCEDYFSQEKRTTRGVPSSAPVKHHKDSGSKNKRLYALTDVTNALRGHSLNGNHSVKQDRQKQPNVSLSESGHRTSSSGDAARGRMGTEVRDQEQEVVEEDCRQGLPATYVEVIDIDKPFSNNIQMVPAYAQANAEFMRELEVQLRARPDYVAAVQPKITSHMRAVLVDWLIEVCDEFKLVTETLYLTVSYIDRFLSVQSIHNSEFQLLGVACMCIAAKYEEIHPPQLERFSYITDHVCSVEDISEAEAEVLQALQFRLSTPTSKAFLQRFLRAAHVATTIEYNCLEPLSRYILELSLLDYSMLRYRSSTVAASAILLARTLLAHVHDESEANEMQLHVVWTGTMEHYTKYSAKDLESCVKQLHRTLIQVSNKAKRQPFVCHKYSQPKWASVAAMNFMEVLPDSMFEKLAAFPVPAQYLAHL